MASIMNGNPFKMLVYALSNWPLINLHRLSCHQMYQIAPKMNVKLAKGCVCVSNDTNDWTTSHRISIIQNYRHIFHWFAHCTLHMIYTWINQISSFFLKSECLEAIFNFFYKWMLKNKHCSRNKNAQRNWIIAQQFAWSALKMVLLQVHDRWPFCELKHLYQ